LSIWDTGQETLAGCQHVVAQLERTCLDVDGDNSAAVAFLDLGADLFFVDRVAAPRELFLAVAGLPDCHALLPLIREKML
jgi:hypothetical protein